MCVDSWKVVKKMVPFTTIEKMEVDDENSPPQSTSKPSGTILYSTLEDKNEKEHDKSYPEAQKN